ncbi:hypothetical protein L7F22_053685 [Adiantum nelumboides]|nr:hypothetical protein [Adiantum nelumboides]
MGEPSSSWQNFNFRDDEGSAQGMQALRLLLAKLQEAQANPRLKPSVNNLLMTEDLMLTSTQRLPSSVAPMHLEGGEGVPVMHGPMQANVVPHPLQGPLQTDGAKKKQYHGQERHVGKIREEGDFHDDDDEPPSRNRHKKRTNERRTKRSRRNSSGGSSSSSQSGRSSHGRFPKKGMEEIQKSPSQISPQGGVFSLDNILDSPKKAKYIPPRVKVIKTFDLSTHHNISWFLDTYDFDGVYQEDLHLYVKQEGQKYGDMGSIVNAKEDLNDMATPCIRITTVRNGKTTKATDISLHLEGWAVADTIGSIQGKENSFGKLGMSIVDFSKLREEGYSYAHLIKAIWKAKAILCPGKKTTGSKKAKTIGSKKEETPSVKKAKLAKQEKAIIISEGREIVKSAIAIMAGERATSSQPFSTQRISSLKNLAPQVEGPTEQPSAIKKSQRTVNINEEEEAHKEISGASKQNEEVEQEMKTCNEESCGASSDEDLQKQSTLHKDKDKGEEEASNVNQDNKETGTSIDKINKDDEDTEDSSKIGSTHTGIIGTKVDCETKDYMDGDEHVEINNAFPNTLMVIEKLVLHPTPQLDPKGVHDLTKHLETTSSPNKEEELKELEDETKSKEINKVLEIGSCILEEVLDVGKSKQTAEVADIENKNDGDEMILEGDMQVEEQVFTRGEKEKGGNEFDVGSNVATTHPHLEKLQPHSSSQKSDTCQRKFDDGFNGQKRDAIVDRVEADSRDCWNMLQPPQLNTLFTIDGMKFEIKTSTIPNAGYGLFAHDNIRESQFLMYYIGIKLDYDSWKTMCAKNPSVKMYSIVEDPNVDKDEDLLYVYGDVNMGNVAGYINSSIYCRHRENVEYQLYPGISPWKTFKQDLVDSKEFGYIGIHATRNINIGEELLCYYNF